jgi:Lipocalin-like domain
MRLCLLLFACHVTLALGQVTPSTAAGPDKQHGGEVTNELVGAWHLVSVDTVRPNGEVIYPIYGRHPEGLLVYDRAGWMSVQIVSDPQPAVPLTDSRQGFLAAPPKEKLGAVDAYYAYYGTWTVDPSGATVTHHIRQSLMPGERGEEVVRQLSIEGNRLTLLAETHEMGENHQRRLIWERISTIH